MGEAVPHVAELTLLDVLFDRIESLLLADLAVCQLNAMGEVAEGPAKATDGVARTSIFALVQRGTSTTMLRTVCCSFA